MQQCRGGVPGGAQWAERAAVPRGQAEEDDMALPRHAAPRHVRLQTVAMLRQEGRKRLDVTAVDLLRDPASPAHEKVAERDGGGSSSGQGLLNPAGDAVRRFALAAPGELFR